MSEILNGFFPNRTYPKTVNLRYHYGRKILRRLRRQVYLMSFNR